MFPFTLPLALSSFVGDCNRSTAAAACVCCSSVNISVEFNAAHIFLFPPFDLETMQNLPPPPPTSETTQLQLLLNRSESPSELQEDGSSTSILSSPQLLLRFSLSLVSWPLKTPPTPSSSASSAQSNAPACLSPMFP